MAITREQQAIDAVRKVLNQDDWFDPLTIKAELQVLRQLLAQDPRPDLTSQITVAGQMISFKKLLGDLSHFNRALNNPLDDDLFTDLSSIKIEHLTFLENNLAAIVAPPEIKESMDAVVPKNLQELLEDQARVTAEKKQALGRPSQLRQQIKQAQEIAIRAQLLRVAVSKSLFITLAESSYIRDLQAIYGKEAVNKLLAQRIDLAVNQSITAFTLNQLGLSDPSKASVYFAAQLEKNLKADPNLAVALAKIPKSSRKNLLTDAKNLAEETATEVQSTARAFRTEQDSSPIYRVNAENIAQGEISAALAKSGLSLTNKQANRLADTLTKYFDQPNKQLQILKRIFPKIALETRQEIISSLQPAISALAGSSDHPSISETINETSLISLARTNPALFPFRLTTAIRGKWLSTVEMAALTIRLSQQLKVSPDYVIMKLAGITTQSLEKHLGNLIKGQPVLGLPTQPPLKPDSQVLQRLNTALPEIGRLDIAQEEFKFNPVASGLNLQNNWHSLTHFFNVGKAIRFNIGRLPPVNRMVSSAQTVFSGLRVQSGAANSMFSFFSFVQRGIRAAPSVITAPFRAVGSLVSAGWGKVKTWAGTQIKAGLAKAGAWLAKKGITAAATKLGLMAVGKGAAALLVQAAPVVGQVVGALTLLSILGDVGKFVWDHKKEIGIGLAGMFFLGQMLLAKVIGFLGSAAWTLGGALTGGIIGFMVGGPVGAAIGTLAGGTIGYLISSGAIGSAIASIGSFLGSAATGISSFIGALSAPSLVAGLGSTIATVGVSGLLISTTITIFFTQPRTNSAMFVPSEKALTGPGTGNDIPPIVGAGTCPLVENPSISTGSLGSGLGRSEHGGRGYGFHCYGIPIKSVWRWNDDPRTVPKSNPATGTSCDISTLNSCNDTPCSYYGFATDVESTSNANPTIRLPIICSDTGTDISQCQPMTWKVIDHFYNCYGGSTTTKEECEAKDYKGVPKHDQLWGWGTIFESHDNNHYWRIYLNHYEKTANVGIGSIFHASLEQADTIGYIPADAYVKHVHIELVMDDNPIRPDFLCDGSAEQPPVNTPTGWVAKVNGANNLVATTNAEYTTGNGQGQPTCSWMDSGIHDSVTVATNANFWGYVGSTKSPRGPASYQNDPISHSLDSNYEFWTVYVDGASTRLAVAESDASNHLFAVSGTPLLVKDGTTTAIPGNPEWNKRVNRVGFGFTGNTYYLVFLQNAYVTDLQTAMINLGVKNAINLDGGSKASLCSRSGGEVQKIVSQGASVPVSVGFIGGTIEPYSPTTTPTPTPSRIR